MVVKAKALKKAEGQTSCGKVVKRWQPKDSPVNQ